jgi:hypothetical protein
LTGLAREFRPESVVVYAYCRPLSSAVQLSLGTGIEDASLYGSHFFSRARRNGRLRLGRRLGDGDERPLATDARRRGVHGFVLQGNPTVLRAQRANDESRLLQSLDSKKRIQR